MESILSNALDKAPELGALVVIVVSFLHYMKDRDKMLEQLHRDHLDAREQTRKALAENTQALMHHRDAVRDLTAAVGRGSMRQ